MILTIDMGNSNIVVGGIDENKLYFEERITWYFPIIVLSITFGIAMAFNFFKCFIKSVKN